MSAQAPSSAAGAVEGERRDDGDRHADHAEEVAAPASRRLRQAAQRQDEEHAGDEVEKVRERLADIASALLLVHREHPLGDEEATEDVDAASTSAMKPKSRASPVPSQPVSGTPTASSAPTMMTEEIALVTDISGVCRAGVTDQTT